MYNYSQTRKEIERINYDISKPIEPYKNIPIELFHKKRLEELKVNLSNVKIQSNEVIRHIENGDNDFLSSIAFKIERNIGLSCSNSSILNNADPDGNNPTFSFNILPDIGSTIVVISWLRIHDNQAGWLVNLCKQDLELLVNFISFYLTEDICINPDLWGSNKEIQSIVKETRHIVDPLFFENIGIKKALKIPELESGKNGN